VSSFLVGTGGRDQLLVAQAPMHQRGDAIEFGCGSRRWAVIRALACSTIKQWAKSMPTQIREMPTRRDLTTMMRGGRMPSLQVFMEADEFFLRWAQHEGHDALALVLDREAG